MNTPIEQRLQLLKNHNTLPLFSIVIGMFELDFGGSLSRQALNRLYEMEIDGDIDKIADFLSRWSLASETGAFLESYFVDLYPKCCWEDIYSKWFS